jgi:hypothetical protein
VEDLIRQLIKEAIRVEHERRADARHPFVYPVSLHIPNAEPEFGFSRDLAIKGIGLILSREWQTGAIADLEIHSSNKPVCIKSEVRWTKQYGDGWFLVGWRFLSMGTLQIADQRGL